MRRRTLIEDSMDSETCGVTREETIYRLLVRGEWIAAPPIGIDSVVLSIPSFLPYAQATRQGSWNSKATTIQVTNRPVAADCNGFLQETRALNPKPYIT